jgi:hypothetical protein
LRTADRTHRKPKEEPAFGAPAIAIVIALVCGLVGGEIWPRSQVTGLILLAIAFAAACMVTYLLGKGEGES